MSYKADFAPPAAEVIRNVDPRLGWRILDAIDRLCDDPVALSKPFYFAAPNRYQMYEGVVEGVDEKLRLRIFFSYMADEQTLSIDELQLLPLEPSSS